MNIKATLLILAVLIALGAVLYPKAYDEAGGFAGKPFSDTKQCIGFSYDTYPEGCADCFTTRYCIGVPLTK